MFFNFRQKIKKLSDNELIVKYTKTSNVEYVGELFGRYSYLIAILAKKYFNSNEDCEDAAMEIFEVLLVDLKKHQVENFKAWLYSVVKNHCLKKVRNIRKYQSSEEIENISDNFVELDGELDLLDINELKEIQFDKLEQSINQLKEEQRDCIKLFYLENKKYNEIVSITGFSLKKVKSYIQNGKRNLKILLEKE